MAKYSEPGFKRVDGLHEVANEIWNAKNGVMISHGVGAVARRAYQRASRQHHDDGSYDYVVATVGSTRSLMTARKQSNGLNADALGVINALNGWDERSREVVRVFDEGKKTRMWMGELSFNELGRRERARLAAPYPIEPFALKLPDAPELFADNLQITCEQTSPDSAAVQTTISFDKGSKVYGFETDGLIVPGPPFGFEAGEGITVFEQDEASVCFGSLLQYISNQIRA